MDTSSARGRSEVTFTSIERNDGLPVGCKNEMSREWPVRMSPYIETNRKTSAEREEASYSVCWQVRRRHECNAVRALHRDKITRCYKQMTQLTAITKRWVMAISKRRRPLGRRRMALRTRTKCVCWHAAQSRRCRTWSHCGSTSRRSVCWRPARVVGMA